MARALAAFVSLLVVSGCSGGDDPGGWWTVAAPDDKGMDAAVLEGAREYAFEPGKNTQGVVVVRDGAIVAEWYAEGWDETSFAASWSVAKSFTSAAIGIALEEGLIPSLDVSMAEYIPEWEGTNRADITLRHVLGMASGLDWVEDYSPTADSSDIVYMVTSASDQLAYASSIELASTPGTVWNYSSGDTMLLSGVLERASGMSAGEYAQRELLSPLGIEPADWWRDAEDHTLTYCCLDTPTRQFAKLGLLYLQQGRWEGEPVVSADWVAESTSPTPADDAYGYQWWLTGRSRAELPDDTFSARGHDGQYIYVIPSLDLVVVRNGLYHKFDGEPVADPYLFSRYPSDGYFPDRGTQPPDEWDDVSFLAPIIDSIRP
ncbi:MAG: serine hydrolase domain-containing protein [Myxococcota bacterium]